MDKADFASDVALARDVSMPARKVLDVKSCTHARSLLQVDLLQVNLLQVER